MDNSLQLHHQESATVKQNRKGKRQKKKRKKQNLTRRWAIACDRICLAAFPRQHAVVAVACHCGWVPFDACSQGACTADCSSWASNEEQQGLLEPTQMEADASLAADLEPERIETRCIGEVMSPSLVPAVAQE